MIAMGYRALHTQGERWLLHKLRAEGHDVNLEVRKNNDVIFDVYDETEGTAWEVLTAKFFKSAHEQDEAIIAKIFRYLLHCKQLRFLVVSVNSEEIKLLHKIGLEHWHIYGDYWSEGLCGFEYHKGTSSLDIAKKIYKALVGYAPIHEWCRKGRRKYHPKAEVEKDFARITRALGLPKNFLIGLWRDWHLVWVWKLENALRKWKLKKTYL
ncbi:MAG: hypothetical protein QW590_02790 [Candidatus Bilamarchaeaceae archaeon]